MDNFHGMMPVDEGKDWDAEGEAYPSAFPFVIGHKSQPEQSLRIVSDFDKHWVNVNVAMTPLEYGQIEVFKSLMEGISLIDPVMEIGGLVSLNAGEKAYFFYFGAVSGVNMGKHSLNFKASLYSPSYKDVLESSQGMVSAYYTYDKYAFLSEADVVSFYGGWVSPPMNVDLSNMEAFKANFVDLKSQSENVIVGVHYNPDAAGQMSYNLESGLKYSSISVNYFF